MNIFRRIWRSGCEAIIRGAVANDRDAIACDANKPSEWSWRPISMTRRAECAESKPEPLRGGDRPDVRVVIITGPQGCGKTRNAESFAAMMGAGVVFDDWDGHTPLSGMFSPKGVPVLFTRTVVLLTSDPYPEPIGQVILFEEAMAGAERAGLMVRRNPTPSRSPAA